VANANSNTVEFKGEGGEQLVAQYDKIIQKDKDLHKQLDAGSMSTSRAAETFDDLSESLEQTADAGSTTALSIGKMVGSFTLFGNIGAAAITWAAQKALEALSKESREGAEAAAKFSAKSEELAHSIFTVGSEAEGAIPKLNRYGIALAQAEARKVAFDTRSEVNKAIIGALGRGAADSAGGVDYSTEDPANARLKSLLRGYTDATSQTPESIGTLIKSLQDLGVENQGLLVKIDPVVKALYNEKQALEAATPKIVTATDALKGFRDGQARSLELANMEADARRIATAGDKAYADAKTKLSKVTDTTAEAIEAGAQAERAYAEGVERSKVAIENAAKARTTGAKAAKDAAADEAREQRRLETFYDRTLAAIRRAEAAKDREAAAQKQREAGFKEYLQDLDLEYELLGKSALEREIRLAQLKEERRLYPNGGSLSADQAGEIRTRLTRNDTGTKRVEAEKKAAEEVQKIWEDAAQGVNDAWSDFLFDIFDKGKFRFGDFAKSLKSIWARTIADMIALSTQQSIVQPLFNAMFGGMQGGGTGAAGTMGAFAKIGGGSDSMGSLADLGDGSGLKVSNGGGFGSLTKSNTSLGGLAGGAMMGMGLGAMTGSGMAGAAGGAIGMAVGGPIGAAIGGLIGGLVGGLFKSTPKSISSYGTSGVTDSMAGGGLDVKIGKDMASGVVRALRTFSEQLLTGIESDEFLGIVGQRGKKFFFQSQQSDLKSAGKGKYGAVKFDSAEEAIAAAIEAAINSGVVKGLTDADKKLMRAAGSVEQAMQDVISSHDFKRELDFQFTGLSNPLAEAQARLEFEYQQQLILADKYEADKTKLEAVYAQKRLDLVEQYNQQQNAALEQSLGGLKDYLFDLTGGSASPLSPTNRLNLAQTRYNDIRKKALAGDKDAIGQLQGASQDFLSASRSVFGSTAGFQSSYQNVVATLSQITGSANPLAAANNNAAAAVNDNTRVQSAYAERAASQRETIISQNAQLISQNAALVAVLSRGNATPTQNGVVTVGAVDWASITQAVASIR
jgi:hypothetical protein